MILQFFCMLMMLTGGIALVVYSQGQPEDTSDRHWRKICFFAGIVLVGIVLSAAADMVLGTGIHRHHHRH